MSKSKAPQATLLEQRTVYFEGHVQGVGFRYSTQQIAGRCRVDGFVKNLDDGRVLLVAEGEPAELDRFLAQVQQALGDYIHSMQSGVAPATGEFRGFRIRY